MLYTLRREKDGAGDSGGLSQVFKPDYVNGHLIPEIFDRPTVGCLIRVGTLSHWWTTTEIVEIVSDTPYEVVFKTKNGSIYTWGIIVS
jgi:hypothetical protein